MVTRLFQKLVAEGRRERDIGMCRLVCEGRTILLKSKHKGRNKESRAYPRQRTQKVASKEKGDNPKL